MLKSFYDLNSIPSNSHLHITTHFPLHTLHQIKETSPTIIHFHNKMSKKFPPKLTNPKNMSLLTSQRSFSCIIPTILLIIIFISPINGFESRKLDETGSSSDPSIKCGGCSPCGNPSCYLSPPPPKPSPPPPSPPPPPKEKPVPAYCPPPPYSPGTGSGDSGFVYMTAPPGQLYPVVDPNYSASPRIFAAAINQRFGFVLLGFFILLF